MKNLLLIAFGLLLFVSCKKEEEVKKTYKADDIIGRYEVFDTTTITDILHTTDSTLNRDTVMTTIVYDIITIERPDFGPGRYTYRLKGDFMHSWITLLAELEDRIYYLPDSSFTYNPATNEISQFAFGEHEQSNPATGYYQYYSDRRHIIFKKIK